MAYDFLFSGVPVYDEDALDSDFPTTVFGNRKADLLHLPEKMCIAQVDYHCTGWRKYSAGIGSIYGVVDADNAFFATQQKGGELAFANVVVTYLTGDPVAQFGYFDPTTGNFTAMSDWFALSLGLNTLVPTSVVFPSGSAYVPMFYISALTASDLCWYTATAGIVRTEV